MNGYQPFVLKVQCIKLTNIGVGHGSLLSTVRFTDCNFVLGVIPPINRWAIIIRPLGRTGPIIFLQGSPAAELRLAGCLIPRTRIFQN
jgi:hypothetical protein